MQTAAGFIPEVAQGGCAPLPRPSKDIRRAFEKLGLEWNEEGTVNRQYAVFTPMPYAGGCKVCHVITSYSIHYTKLYECAEVGHEIAR